MKLVIAEKPSVAMALAQVVSATARKDGYMEGNYCAGRSRRWICKVQPGISPAMKD